MNHRKLLFITAFILCLAGLFSQEADRGLEVRIKGLGDDFKVGKQYLVIIGIDKYQEWPSLKNPVDDARTIMQIITERYYIDRVFALYDEEATKANILKLFNDLQQLLKTADSVLIFYSGHGHLDRASKTGFWIPVNGGVNIFEQANWIPNSQLRGLIAGFKTTHVLLISDSCFSGDILNATRSGLPEIDTAYFRRAYSLASRQVLTSGASETVPDESEFARMLKLVLEKNEKPYLDPLMLYSEIRLGMKETLPLFGNLKDTGHQDGASFILFLKVEPVPKEETAKTEEPKPQAEAKETKIIIKQPDADTAKKTKEPKSMDGGFVRLGFGVSFPVGNLSGTLSYGITSLVSLGYQFSLGPGFFCLGLEIGTDIGGTLAQAPSQYKLYTQPLGAFIGYALTITDGFYLQAEVGGGYTMSYVNYDNTAIESGFVFKPYFAAKAGVSIKLSNNLRIEADVLFNSVFFDINPKLSIAPELCIAWVF